MPSTDAGISPVSDALRFDLRIAFDGLDLRSAGAFPLEGITALTGPSGAGKTTLLRALAGLEPRATGQIHLGATPWQDGTTRLPTHRRGIGFVFQDTRLFPHLDVAQNLAYGATRRGGNLAPVIDALDLQPLLSRAVQSLSGGEARRVAIGRALAAAPKLLFLDEPLVGLDALRRERILGYIGQAVERFALPTVYITHSDAEIARIASRRMYLARGGALSERPLGLTELTGHVTACDPSHIEVQAAGLTLRLSGAARPGSTVRIRIAHDGLVVTSQNPGQTSAAATRPARVTGQSLALSETSLTFPLPPSAEGRFADGSTVWVALTKAEIRH